MKKLAISLIFLSLPCLLEAQTNQCDATIINNPSLTSPVRATFCHKLTDTNGNTIVISAFKVYIDNTIVVFNGSLTPIGTPTADGRRYFETPPFAVTRGSHTSQVSAVNADGIEGGKTAPFPFDVIDLPPAVPSNSRIIK